MNGPKCSRRYKLLPPLLLALIKQLERLLDCSGWRMPIPHHENGAVGFGRECGRVVCSKNRTAIDQDIIEFVAPVSENLIESWPKEQIARIEIAAASGNNRKIRQGAVLNDVRQTTRTAEQ